MKKIVSFLVEKRYFIISFMMILSIASVFMMQHVNINSDMSKYLPDNSLMKKGLNIMNKEFPNIGGPSYEIMFENLSTDEKQLIYEELNSTKGVASVLYEINSESYNKDNYTLYIINTDFDENNESNPVLSTVKDMYEDKYTIHTAVFANSDPVSSNQNTLDYMIPIAGVILIIILLIMCASWFEPVLFLFTIAIAVLINMGTNILLPDISNMTFSITAVIQLVLSIDYSIILMNRYRQEKRKLPDGDKITAMKNAILKSFKSIISSSGTTIVGLLALIFMSFKIGQDMGIVFAKGVFISLISIFTILPSLILMSDKIITKTLKKPFHLKKITTKGEGGVNNV